MRMENQIYIYRRMSITVSNCDEICHSPTNNSKGKMLYSFSKSMRFANKKQFYCDKFYDASKQHIRTTSQGFGQKFDFFKQIHQSPPPTSYNLKSDFENDPKKGMGFGEGREEMKITGPFVATQKNKNPGPGAYPLNSTLNHLSYSMRGKSPKLDKEKIKVPGPGTYEAMYNLNQKGKYYSSKHKNCCVRGFNDSVKRGTTFHTISPGPGNYDTSKQDLSPDGKYVLSRMKNAFVRTFGKSYRQSLLPKNLNPGPGNYRLPSEFGYYAARTAPGSQRNKYILIQNENKEND